MKESERFAFYKDLYFHELARRDSLNGSVALPLAMVAVIGSGIAYLWKGRPDLGLESWPLLYNLALTVAASSLLVAAYQLIRASWGLNYYHLPTVGVLEGDRVALERYADGYSDQITRYNDEHPEDPLDYDLDFQNLLVGHFVLASQYNLTHNEAKSAHIHKARVAIVTGLVALGIGLIPLLALGGQNDDTGQGNSQTTVTAAALSRESCERGP